MTSPFTDSHLHVLERRFLQSSSPTDEAAYLLERVRAGERLRRAAHLGDAAARVANSAGPVKHESLDVWFRGLGLRAFVAVARMFSPASDLGEAALRAAEAWCVEPTPANAVAAHEAAVADLFVQSGGPYLGGLAGSFGGGAADPAHLASWSSQHVALVTSRRKHPAPRVKTGRAIEWTVEGAVAAASIHGGIAVRVAALVPWALARRELVAS